jgi:perosamine synthetase
MSQLNPFVGAVLARMQEVLGMLEGPVALHEPQFSGNEWKYVKECLDTGWVSSGGKFVDEFERKLCEVTGASHAIAVVNGTAALHICLKLSGVTADEEVLMPSLTFVASANAVMYCNAVPHFVDVEERTLGVCPSKLQRHLMEIAVMQDGVCLNRQTGRRIRTLVPMHTFGHPVDLSGLKAVADRFCIQMVEDAAESLGSLYEGSHTGNMGLLSSLSFNGNKIATTGGGGAILTNNPEIASLAKHLTTTAKLPHRWRFDHDVVGYNYRLPNINAALGCAQLESLPESVLKKRRLFERYRACFADLQGIRVFEEPQRCKSNYWLQALILDPDHANLRDEILEATNDAELMTRPVWTPMHQLKQFAAYPKMDLAVTESLSQRIINVPSSPQLI